MIDIVRRQDTIHIVPRQNTIPAMSIAAIEAVRTIEEMAKTLPQTKIETTHTFHAGVYARTVKLPAGTVITGALIKIATIVIISGDVQMYTETGTSDLSGYHVFPAMAGRKQAFHAKSDTHITMLFATDVTTVTEAEAQFTDETDLLITNREKD